MKRYLQFLTAAAIGSMLSFSATAAPLSPQQALNAAIPSISKLKKQAANNALNPESFKVKKTIYADEMPAIYIMSSKNQGSLILAADDCVDVLLGYTDNGELDLQNIPGGMNALLSGYAEDIKTIISQNRQFHFAPVPDGEAVAPLLSSKWNQMEPFNNLAPDYNGTRCPSGCVATATTQIMRYHAYPEHGNGSVSYKWYDDNYLSWDLENTKFNYDLMIDQYQSGGYSQEQGDAIAQFTAAVGRALQINYNPSGSGTMSDYVATALVYSFNYDNRLRLLHRHTYSLAEWNKILYDEMVAERPVYYSGFNDEGGHAFVIDGYDPAGYFHVNWGWGGGSDGYFLIGGLTPASQGVGGSNGGYNDGQMAIIGIRPPAPEDESVPAIDLYLNFDFGPKTTTFKRSTTGLTFVYFGEDSSVYTGGWQNTGLRDLNLYRGVAFENEQGEVKYVWTTQTVSNIGPGCTIIESMPVNFGKKMQIMDADLENGKYTVYPVYRLSDEEENESHRVRVAIGKRDYVTMTLTDTDVKFEYPKKASLKCDDDRIQPLSPLYSGCRARLKANLIGSVREYYGDVVLKLCKSMSGALVATLGSAKINVPVDETVEFVWDGMIPAGLSGEYAFRLETAEQSWITTSYLDITEAPEGDPVVQINNLTIEDATMNGGGMYDPHIVNGNHLKIGYDVNVSSGYFTNKIMCIIRSGWNVLHNVTCPQVYVSAGETLPQKLDFVAHNTQPGETYNIHFKQRYTNASGYTVDKEISNFQYFVVKNVEVGVDEAQAEKMIILCDPVAKKLSVSGAEVKNISIYNLQGEHVLTASAGELNYASLPAGLYIVYVATPSGTEVQKMRL